MLKYLFNCQCSSLCIIVPLTSFVTYFLILGNLSITSLLDGLAGLLTLFIYYLQLSLLFPKVLSTVF